MWSPGTPRDAPYGGDRTRYAPAGTRFGLFSFVATELAAERGVEGAKQVLYDETRDNFQAFLDAREPGRPFCYWWGPTNTHRKWQRGSGKQLWGLQPDDLKGRLPAFLPDVHDVREDVCDYLGECQAVDAGLGVLIAKLEEIGELDNTLLVVSGDHGIPGFPRGKCNLYNLGCEVALAARWPGRVPPGRTVHDFVNLMDLAPTFLEAAGVERLPGMAAHSLLPVLESPASGQVEALPATTSCSAENAMSRWRAPAISLTRNAPSAPAATCTSATSSPTAGRWATRAAWTTRPPCRRRTRSCARTPG